MGTVRGYATTYSGSLPVEIRNELTVDGTKLLRAGGDNSLADPVSAVEWNCWWMNVNTLGIDSRPRLQRTGMDR
jgi:hypothetical protein